jgi:hypothetical protein
MSPNCIVSACSRKDTVLREEKNFNLVTEGNCQHPDYRVDDREINWRGEFGGIQTGRGNRNVRRKPLTSLSSPSHHTQLSPT